LDKEQLKNIIFDHYHDKVARNLGIDVKEAIKKYFQKYNIHVINQEFDKGLFENPLLLKIFSQTNRGGSIEVNETSIYRALDNYVSEVITRIASHEGNANPLIKDQVLQGLNDYSALLWSNNNRGVSYPGDVASCLDPVFINTVLPL